MTDYVVDASVAVKWVLDEDLKEEARALLSKDHSRHAPDLLMAEVGNVLWKSVQRELLDVEKAKIAIDALLDVDMTVYPCSLLVSGALEIGDSYQCSVYDGMYAALAESLGMVLITADKKLYNKIALGGPAISIQLLGAPVIEEGDPENETG